jgi:hypothetical protein
MEVPDFLHIGRYNKTGVHTREAFNPCYCGDILTHGVEPPDTEINGERSAPIDPIIFECTRLYYGIIRNNNIGHIRKDELSGSKLKTPCPEGCLPDLHFPNPPEVGHEVLIERSEQRLMVDVR